MDVATPYDCTMHTQKIWYMYADRFLWKGLKQGNQTTWMCYSFKKYLVGVLFDVDI